MMAMRATKGQSAVEYLMTYGWMLLVVAIAGGAVFSMVQDQSIESVNGFSSNDLDIRDFAVSGTGTQFLVSSKIGKSHIEEIRVVDSSSEAEYVVNKELDREVLYLPGLVSGRDSGSVEMEIQYSSGSLESLVTDGTINGKLALDSSMDNKTVIQNGLIAYWPFKQDSTESIRDWSVQDNDFEVHGETNMVSGKTNNAVNFDGNGSYIGTQYSFDQPEEVSVSLWFNADIAGNSMRGIDGESYSSTIINNRDGTNGWWVEWRSNGVLQFSMYEDGNYTSNTLDTDFTSTNEWHNIIATISENGRVRVWLDNNKEIDRTIEGKWRDSETPFWFGTGNIATDYTNPDSHNQYFAGSIDEIKVFDRALTSEEVQILYENDVMDE